MTADTAAAEIPEGARLLTPEQAWTYLGISKPKLYELSRSGDLGYIQLPARTPNGFGDRRYEIGELDRFIERNRVPAASPS